MLRDVTRRKLALSSGIEIALIDWGGDGPPLLLHHANGFCAAIWDGTAEGLRADYRVFAMDARGHGNSSKPEPPEPYAWRHFGADVGEVARRLAAELGVGRLRAGVGNSFGGTSLLLASAGEAPFEELVLVDPVLPPPAPRDGPARRGNTLAEGALKRRAVWASREEARRLLAEKPLFASWEPRALDLYVGEGLRDCAEGVALQCPPEVEAAVFSQSFGADVVSAVDRVSIPVLFARAGRGYFPPELFEAMAERTLRGRYVEVDVGHLAPMEDSAAVAALVRDTLTQTSTG